MSGSISLKLRVLCVCRVQMIWELLYYMMWSWNDELLMRANIKCKEISWLRVWKVAQQRPRKHGQQVPLCGKVRVLIEMRPQTGVPTVHPCIRCQNSATNVCRAPKIIHITSMQAPQWYPGWVPANFSFSLQCQPLNNCTLLDSAESPSIYTLSHWMYLCMCDCERRW